MAHSAVAKCSEHLWGADPQVSGRKDDRFMDAPTESAGAYRLPMTSDGSSY